MRFVLNGKVYGAYMQDGFKIWNKNQSYELKIYCDDENKSYDIDFHAPEFVDGNLMSNRGVVLEVEDLGILPNAGEDGGDYWIGLTCGKQVHEGWFYNWHNGYHACTLMVRGYDANGDVIEERAVII